MAGVKAGRVRLCRVAGNTVESHMASEGKEERGGKEKGKEREGEGKKGREGE